MKSFPKIKGEQNSPRINKITGWSRKKKTPSQDSDVANDPDLKEPTIQPSLWCRIAYVIALGRVAFSILVITQLSPEGNLLFEDMVEVFASLEWLVFSHADQV